MAVYAIRYTDRALEQKAGLPAAHRASLEAVEKALSLNPYGEGTSSNHDNSWSAVFMGGFVTYIVSNCHVVINVIAVAAV